MSQLTLICRAATPFATDGSLDEGAFRKFLQRFVDSGIGVYLASGGSGEGHALTLPEIKRVYEIGVEVCKGKVQVNANPPERHTVADNREQIQCAIDGGAEIINVYGPASWHGYKANHDELLDYYDAVLEGFNHPIALAPNPIIGYTPKAATIAAIAKKYHQVVSVNLAGLNDGYFVELRDLLRPEVEIYVPYPGSINTFAAGATGLLGAEANIIPKTFRKYLDAYSAGDKAAIGAAYDALCRFSRYIMAWHSASPRWIKLAMRVLKLPGGEGGVRRPYMMPDDAEIRKFANGLLKLNIPEINDYAAAAGLKAQA
jgi:4-hydroxy-tetrahydrodipicolinate synthase